MNTGRIQISLNYAQVIKLLTALDDLITVEHGNPELEQIRTKIEAARWHR